MILCIVHGTLIILPRHSGPPPLLSQSVSDYVNSDHYFLLVLKPPVFFFFYETKRKSEMFVWVTPFPSYTLPFTTIRTLDGSNYRDLPRTLEIPPHPTSLNVYLGATVCVIPCLTPRTLDVSLLFFVITSTPKNRSETPCLYTPLSNTPSTKSSFVVTSSRFDFVSVNPSSNSL